MSTPNRFTEEEAGKILIEYMEEKQRNPDTNMNDYLQRFRDDQKQAARKILEMGEVLLIPKTM